ncbi:MAG: hypothetical protein IT323_14235 [Anaerolineae bacterium]|nr:hypothetical protein [Anaerolineae bacterium]
MTVHVQIIGMPVACMEGIGDPWRARAVWIAQQLASRFGDAVRLDYHSLYDADCPPPPEGATFPLVRVGDALVQAGGENIPLPPILRAVEASLAADAHDPLS